MKILTNLTIKNRLFANAIVVAIALSILFGMMLVNSNVLNTLGLSLAKVEKLEAQVLTLRKHEKDFLARKDMKYVKEFQSTVKKLQKNTVDLQLIADELNFEVPELSNFAKSVKDYAIQFDTVSALQVQIGLTPTTGLYGELRSSVHEAEEELKNSNSYKLLTYMLQLRRAEKDFMLRRDVKYLDKFDAGMQTFRQQLILESMPASELSNIQSYLAIYESKFKQLAKAETDIGLDAKSGALGKLRATIHQTESSLDSIINSLEVELAERVDSTIRNATIVFIVAMIFTLFIVYTTSRSILMPILAVRNAISHIRRNNDLTWLVKSKGKDELVELSTDVNSLVADFRNLIMNVNTALNTLDNSTDELASNTQNTLEGMELQFSESDMVATSGAEMQATVADISQNTQLATATANKTGEMAQAGAKEVGQTVANISELANQLKNALTQIEKLEKDSQLIGTVSDAIRGIAEQTNLLALNAAIEAARAGEQGRGFAVVADEVRSLAMRTQESTSEIETIISSLQSSTQTIVDVVNQCYKNGIECSEQAQSAGESLGRIASHVDEVVGMNSQISASLQEQDMVATEMSKHVIKIRDIASDSQERAAINADASRDIAKQAAILHQEIERYKTAS
ncbi:methyl-accepting chemotaxis protein [Psychrosphaera aquimarina]|uniref:Methyl-accepting chemotaxis protein n=1 Tax=Psychrosphaera aquimarina TaxID=2044854 RepID=A0ABU3R1Q2_9GAMM|nr:methyl-accepting chemotaxis protein [Psychrosphaera aquimarina]MDU0113610.1 methyl-accepting chemotaxis protein [Psychrosphaera aquimarina]